MDKLTNSGMDPLIKSKLKHLDEELQEMGSVAVAYSGGTDSTFLLYMSKKALGSRAVGIINITPVVSPECVESARKIAGEIGAELIEIHCIDDRVLDNTPDRCYICKKATLEGVILKAREIGIKNIVDGTIADDDPSFRPGMKALSELGIRSPLRDIGLNKKEILAASRVMGISEARSETCLATRIPFNTPLTADKLNAVDMSEIYIRSLGVPLCRVRYHEDIARIEVPFQYVEIITSNKENIIRKLKENGFKYVCLDLEGYNPGSMDRGLSP